MNFMGKATSAEGQEHRSIASQAENGQGDMDIYADTVDTDSVATDESQGPVTESLDAPVGMPAKSVMKIAADYTQSRSLNEGHWALLLNEVCTNLTSGSSLHILTAARLVKFVATCKPSRSSTRISLRRLRRS